MVNVTSSTPSPSLPEILTSRYVRKITLLSVLALVAIPILGQTVDPADTILSELTRLDSRQMQKLDSEWTEVLVVDPPSDIQAAKKGKHEIPRKYDVSMIGNRGTGKGVNFYSLEREQALGREMSREVEAQSKLFRDPVVNEYINRIGQNLVRNSDAEVPFVIKVIESDEINAFALPGGFFYVNTGLILEADSEAELAGVMAHEIGHVAARHATKNMTKGQIWNLASIPLIFVGGPVGYAVQQVASVAVPMSFLKFSRDAEREADLLGLEYQYKAGYDPISFVNFFEKIKAQEKQKANFVSKAFATHPMTSERVSRAQKEINTLLPPMPRYVVDTSEFVEIKARLMGILNQRKLVNPQSGRPALKRRENEPDTGTTTTPPGDDRPTLKRPPVILP